MLRGEDGQSIFEGPRHTINDSEVQSTVQGFTSNRQHSLRCNLSTRRTTFSTGQKHRSISQHSSQVHLARDRDRYNLLWIHLDTVWALHLCERSPLVLCLGLNSFPQLPLLFYLRRHYAFAMDSNGGTFMRPSSHVGVTSSSLIVESRQQRLV